MKRLLQLNPDNRPATWEQIKQWRDIHEVAPIETSYGVFDCDDRSDKRLQEQLDLFDQLTTLNPDGSLNWKMADNTWQSFTKEALADAYNQVRVKRAKRAGVLHVKAAEFDAMNVKPSIAELKSLDFWVK